MNNITIEVLPTVCMWGVKVIDCMWINPFFIGLVVGLLFIIIFNRIFIN